MRCTLTREGEGQPACDAALLAARPLHATRPAHCMRRAPPTACDSPRPLRPRLRSWPIRSRPRSRSRPIRSRPSSRPHPRPRSRRTDLVGVAEERQRGRSRELARHALDPRALVVAAQHVEDGGGGEQHGGGGGRDDEDRVRAAAQHVADKVGAAEELHGRRAWPRERGLGAGLVEMGLGAGLVERGLERGA